MPDAPSVLVAEDDPQFRAGILTLLKPLALNCIAVEDGRRAIEVLRDLSQDVHLVITDMRMPVGSGWEVIEAARKHRGQSLPVIMQTGEAQYSDVQSRARDLGITPMDKADVRRCLVPAVREALRIFLRLKARWVL
jgi:CheY-like chemotaxis protein